MINREATIRWKGYDPCDLKPYSRKRVWSVCDVCGKGRWLEMQSYSAVCYHCAITSEETRKKMSKAKEGMFLGADNPNYGKGLFGADNGMFNRNHSKESRKKIGDKRRGKYVGKNAPGWKGGISPDRSVWQHNGGDEWRQMVFRRDNYTCQECAMHGGDLNAHHILPYRDWKEPQYSLNVCNGITLCKECHRNTFGNEYEFFSKYFDIVNGVR